MVTSRVKSTASLLTLCACLCGMLLTPGWSGDARAQTVSLEAERHFDAGVKLLDDPDGPRYAEAYSAFKAAYEASNAPVVLGNLGLCAMKIERDGEALDAYRRYLAEAKRIPPRERTQIAADIELLEARIATVVLEDLRPGMTVVDERIPVNGARIVNRYGPVQSSTLTLRVRAGDHRISVEYDRKDVWSTQRKLKAGEAVTEGVVLAADQPGPDEAPSADFPMLPVVFTGTTVLFALVTTITGGLALERQSAFEDANDGTDPAAAAEIRDAGQALNIATDVFLGATMVSGAAATFFWILWGVGDDDTETAAWQPLIGPHCVGIRRRF